jgi:transposase, IS30 family
MQNYQHFSKAERLELSILLEKGYSLRAIARSMERSHATISRERRRMGKASPKYDPGKAQQKAQNQRRFSKYQGMKVRNDSELEQYVREKMELFWSPEQIAGALFVEQGRCVGKDAIYKYLYSNHGQALCEFLYRKRYQPKRRRKKKEKHEIIKDRIFISARPALINERKRFGDYEGDTMGRPKKASPYTLVVMRERYSRRVFAKRVARLKYAMRGFKNIRKNNIMHSLTLDNGVENARYKELDVSTYFCDPYSPWQKGSVENAIGLLRRFIPKKADLKDFSQAQIDSFLDIINNTPMKVLGFLTPNQVFDSFSSS